MSPLWKRVGKLLVPHVSFAPYNPGCEGCGCEECDISCDGCDPDHDAPEEFIIRIPVLSAGAFCNATLCAALAGDYAVTYRDLTAPSCHWQYLAAGGACQFGAGEGIGLNMNYNSSPNETTVLIETSIGSTGGLSWKKVISGRLNCCSISDLAIPYFSGGACSAPGTNALINPSS